MEHDFLMQHLESRSLFSVVGPVGMAPTAPMTAVHATSATTNPLLGAFNVAGKYTQPFGNPDTGAQYKFNGTGKTTALGTFTVTGHVQLPGFIASARAGGALTITTAHGTITLSVHGPQQTPGTFPPFFSFSIVRGTGSYAKSSGKGVFAIAASSTTHKFVFKFNQKS